MMRHPAPRMMPALRLSVGIVFLLSACAGPGTASPLPSQPIASGTEPGQPPGVQNALDLIQQYEAIPAFEAPGPPVDIAEVEGKLIFNVPGNPFPFCVAVDEQQKKWAEAAGARYFSFQSQGQLSDYVQAFDVAIAQEADVILLTCGVEHGQLQPQVQAANSAGIPVIAGHTYDQAQDVPPNVAARMDGQFSLAGRLMAAWAIAQTNGRLNILVITDNEFSATQFFTDAIKAELEGNCPDCKAEYADVTVDQWATRIGTITQTAISRDPELNFVVPLYDSMTQFVLPAIVATGSEDRIQVASFNGTPFVLDMIREEDIVTMDVGESLEWIAMATLDQAFRLLVGMDPVPSEISVLRVFNDSNVRDAGVPANIASGYGDDYVSGFRELWGLSE